MENKDIIRLLRLTTTLLEVHNENVFKIRGYQNAVATLERLNEPLKNMPQEEIAAINGIGKSLAANIREMLDTGSFPQLRELVEQTPEGVIRMLDIKGLGPKKVRQIWQEMEIVDTEALLEACEQGTLAKVKGFGAKTQETILASLRFTQANKGKARYADLESYGEALEKELQQAFKDAPAAIAGEYRRRLEIIENLVLLVAHSNPKAVINHLNTLEYLEQHKAASGPFVWRGLYTEPGVKVELHICPPEQFSCMLLKLTGSTTHLQAKLKSGKSLLEVAAEKQYESEEAIYKAAELSFVAPELREGFFELPLAEEGKLPTLLENSDLKGSLHNHSTYSDGKHSLREMAEHCRDLGYEYLGISDHSKTAFYAGGLEIERVLEQHKEIEQLNQELAPFKIFKGIESDILPDGALDYPEDILKRFDFIVASIHGNLNMSLEKATERLLTAIANPYTTILGHPTGRLLLRREGYPIDHRAVIDACAEHGVIIEINANPWRLDLDWRWVQYALEQGVLISINPDAHEKDGYLHMQYGVLAGRKGGLTAEQTFNARSAKEVEQYFLQRKERAEKKA
ncbi:DNA polymerase/3'-5' exonuclease PolX [Nafulsella turpanensis]|uniref:DNA polymerase/3'-5' exonuclease PolX n=1 Tax=Nafulsella turpanensis TaxID=1265690 RepID=UPI00036C9C7F|nr:DNA polymerase/3'-5' exonuclease PolX [Nafulsella turpanensis]